MSGRHSKGRREALPGGLAGYWWAVSFVSKLRHQKEEEMYEGFDLIARLDSWVHMTHQNVPEDVTDRPRRLGRRATRRLCEPGHA